MFLLILWVSTIFNTCNKKKQAELANSEMVADSTDTTAGYEDLDDALFEESADDIFGETSEDNSSSVTDGGSSGTTTDALGTTDPEEYTDYTTKPDPVSKTGNASTSSSSSTSYSDDAGYLVVAGSFLVKENADKMVRQLTNLGYTAEVRNFNYSQYHSVIAGRYTDKASADRAAAKIKAEGINCYVHKRQP